MCFESVCFKNSACLLIALLLVACQPPAPNDELRASDKSEIVDTPLIIGADSVTMTPKHILNIKSSRYQPSLGLQGNIEPTKQTQLISAYALRVEKVLVTTGQWVEKGTPLLIVRRQVDTSKQTNLSNETDAENSGSTNLNPINLGSAATANNEARNQNAISSATNKDTSLEPLLPSNQQDSKEANDLETKSQLSPNDDASNSGVNSSQGPVNSEKSSQLITIRASFSGRVDALYVQPKEQIAARKPLLHLSDETDLRFIATLPIQAKPQLSVGQTVNFTTQGLSEKFTGQVSNLVASDQPNQLLVYVHVVKNDASRSTLKPGMFVTGRVDYGQIEVGTVVPKRALHDVDLKALETPPYQSLTPLTANVWTIKQDQLLTRQPVEVIKYDPSTGQYLIAGISNDSLICLADLPVESAGKKVVIS
ncbi:efflux RND transporter periplasmic adaptor subunit [Psychrobacter sp. 72-O-c]|uniref:efflux RND transporter periplasmic adaptor subunit n=1 Tax=Psychrobacter sp. 72-O-c TaxID=2774125 RepID=UPI001D0F76CE|nr:HlyD family efflux transporter periplasmic adaptor subunit [Psychrobacter sp. 72-O-c]